MAPASPSYGTARLLRDKVPIHIGSVCPGQVLSSARRLSESQNTDGFPSEVGSRTGLNKVMGGWRWDPQLTTFQQPPLRWGPAGGPGQPGLWNTPSASARWFSRLAPQTRRTSSTWELTRNANTLAPPPDPKISNSGGGAGPSHGGGLISPPGDSVACSGGLRATAVPGAAFKDLGSFRLLPRE